MSYGEWLGTQLERRQISQRVVGIRAGVDHSTISRILGNGRDPSLRTMTRLAIVVGWPPTGVLTTNDR
jgi:transcriptional regulator with XRE-family HTH domain